VLALVLTESLALPSVAGGAGFAAWLFIQRSNPTGGTVPMSALSPSEIVLGALIALLLGLAAAVVPAWHVRRLSIVDGLRRAR
jgi:putative ABC transport system permease protein